MDDRLVIDANVVIKWFLRDSNESEIEKADMILDALMSGDVVLHAPGIFTYEVCGALTKACGHRLSGSRTPRRTKELAVSAIRDLFKLPINIHVTSEQEAGTLPTSRWTIPKDTTT